MSPSFRLLRAALPLVALLPAPAAFAAAPLDYNRDIKPILAENCFSCHGFDEASRKAKLRLDIADSATAARDGTVAIKPGDPAKSEAWLRIISPHEDEVMPPPEAHKTLTAAQKNLLKTWIEQGAPYAQHWAFVPPVKAPLPAAGSQRSTPNSQLPAHPIDAFVRAKLAAEKLTPSAPADPATLLRRLSLDLTGLPPTGEEVAAFVRDSIRDPESAIRNSVARLLASPHFGERLALDWLDAARYADTNGYSIDGGRHMWLWRDWVIQAFNDNKPYDRFLLEQLAGDLLPNRTDADLIATGFQRNNMVTHEGGTIPEENLTNYNVDRVKTLGESVLGLTLACAQCHDHKFDPISQRDYYQVYAFFNSLSDKGLDGNAGINPGPMMDARTVLRTAEEPQLRREIADLKQKLATRDDTVLAAWIQRERAQLAARGRGFALHEARMHKVSTPNRGAGFDLADGNRVKIGDVGDLAAFDLVLELPPLDQPVTGLRVVVYPQDDLPGGGWGRGPRMTRPAPARPTKAAKTAKAAPTAASDLSTLNAQPSTAPATPATPAPATPVRTKATKTAKAATTPTPAPSDPSTLNAQPSTAAAAPAAAFKGTFRLTAVCLTPGPLPSDQVNLHKLHPIARVTASSWDPQFPPAGVLDPRNETAWSPDPAATGPVHLTATFAQPFSARENPFVTVQVNFGWGRATLPGLLQVFFVTGTDDGTDLPADIVAALGEPDATRSAETTARLWAHCTQDAEEFRATHIALANLEERLATLTQKFSTMVMNVAPKPRDTFILNRGDYAQPTDQKVSPGTPAVLPPMPEGAPADRLGLAQWLTQPTHPLTARVAVNRIWRLFFEQGLVASAADFGTQGEWPSHPELLDWLAVDFVQHGWDVKRLVTQIVTSATYRQSSATSAALLERDPQNRLLARGPRFRLPAEFVRDHALKVAGLLVPRIGGPSVNPYTPVDLWREVSHYGSTPATSQTFVQDHGEKLYRRSLYTYWKRTAPPPNMTAFDAPNREVCVVARGNTTTPLQALVTLNDTQFVEAARVFAQRILAQPGDDSARLKWAFTETTSRPPTAPELKVISGTLTRERTHYAKNAPAAQALLAHGEFPRPDVPAAEHAAWTKVATLLLNLSEAITRN